MRRLQVITQQLAAGERAEITRHLQRLSPHDRRLRFGAYMSEAVIERYVQRMDFSHDRVFGVFDRQLGLTGVAHLALDPGSGTAELGLSVDVSCRGRGYGFALLKQGKRHATAFGCEKLFMHCLAENQVMIHLAQKAGMTVITGQGEADAYVALKDDTSGDTPREILGHDVALVE